MELNLCPGCDAFVGRDWDVCRTCGHVLTHDVPEQAHDAQSVVEDIAGKPVEPEAVDYSAFDAPPPFEPAPPVQSGSFAGESVPKWEAGSSWGADVVTDPETLPPPPAAKPSTGWAPSWSAADEPRWEPPTDDPPPYEAAPDSISPAYETQSFDGDSTPTYAPTHQRVDARSTIIEDTEDADSPTDGWIGTTLTSTNERNAAKTLLLVMSAVIAVAVVAMLIFALVIKGDDGASSSTTTTTAASANAGPADWTSYFDPGGRFSVELPAPPKVSSQQINGLESTSTQADTTDGRSTIVITATALPAGVDWSRNDQALQDALQGSASSTNAKVRSAVTTTVNGHRELNAHLESDDAVYDARYFASNGTLFVILVASHHHDGDPATYSRVTDSFRSLKP